MLPEHTVLRVSFQEKQQMHASDAAESEAATAQAETGWQEVRELIVDNFAGGGGASLGIMWATGRPVDIAINHDPAAIAMYKANFPDTIVQARGSEVDIMLSKKAGDAR